MKLRRKIVDECLACVAIIILVLFIGVMALYEKITRTTLIDVDESI